MQVRAILGRSKLRKLIPQRLKDGIQVLLGWAIAYEIDARAKFSCPVCGAKNVLMKQLPLYYLREMDRHQYIHSLFQAEALNIEHYSCYHCKASDRDRLYALYIRKVMSSCDRALRLLEVAPSESFTRFLKSYPQLQVRTADLFMKGVDDKVDLMDMHQYSDGQFDVFVCSHVLEHVDDDVLAMRELFRVLVPGGWGIVMVPISLALQEVYENSSIIDEGGRWKHFGQNDHVRVYSRKGFVQRLSSVGFFVRELDQAFFGEEIFAQNAVHPRSVLYVVEKPSKQS